VNTGAAVFTIKKANFNVIDSVVVASKAIVSSSNSPLRGLVITGPNPSASYPANVTCNAPGQTAAPGQSFCSAPGVGTIYSSANDPGSTCAIDANGLENGPVMAVVKCTGTHFDGANHPYMHYTARLTFFKGKNSVKVSVILRNADYNPPIDSGGNTFDSAYKGFQSYELRITPNIQGTLAYTMATDAATQTGTLNQPGGTDSVYIYQGQSQALIGNSDCAYQSACANSFTTDLGYVAQKNNATIVSGGPTQYPQGWMDCSDSSGTGIEIGVYQLAAYSPKSLECDGGGTDMRIGIFPGENSKATYQPWPAWTSTDLFLEFHDSAPASLANEFLKFQHYLVGRSSAGYHNSTSVFPYPIDDPVQEDSFMVTVANTSQPPIALSKLCYGGGTSNCIPDVGTTDLANFPLSSMRYWAWSSGGPGNQEEFRWSDLLNFIKRGQPGRYLQSSHFYRTLIEKGWPHTDGVASTDASINAYTWRGRPNPELDALGQPALGCQGNPPGSTCSHLDNSNNAFVDWVSNDPLHMHWYGLPDFYFMTGDETIKEALVSLKDFYLNTRTYMGAHYNAVGGGVWYVRALGVYMLSSSRFSDYLAAIGDMDSAGVLASGIQAYQDMVKPDLCVNGFPAGCTPDPVSAYPARGYDNPGVSKVRGTTWAPVSRGQGWCADATGGQYSFRGNDMFAYSLVTEGLLALRRSNGPSWSEYENALDLAYGISSWAITEAFADDGSSLWLDGPNNGKN